MVRRVGQRHVGRRHADGHGEPDGEPPQLHGEDHQDEQTQPKRGRGRQQKAIAAHHAVDRAAAARAGDDAQHEAQHAADQPRDAHESQRVCRTVRDHLGHRRVEPERRSHVTMQKRARPVGEPLPKRHVAAPIAGQLRTLGLRHVHVCGLPHVSLNRVDGRSAHQREHHQPHRQHEQHEPHDMSSKILRHAYLCPKSRNLARKPFGPRAQKPLRSPKGPTPARLQAGEHATRIQAARTAKRGKPYGMPRQRTRAEVRSRAPPLRRSAGCYQLHLSTLFTIDQP